MPAKLIEQVTMLIYVVPDAASWISWVENMVNPAIHMGSCSLASSGGIQLSTLGGSSPCRDLAISTNPGGGVHHWLVVSSCCGSSFWVRVADGLTAWVVAVGLDHLTLQFAKNDPLEQALQLLLWLWLWFLPPLEVGSSDLDIVILIQSFWVVPPIESPKIMRLKGIHSPKALCRQVGLSFCPWCGKEGQNKSTVVNHLQTGHYHLGLICSQCLKYFTTSANTMCHHLQLCKLALAGINDDDQEEESWLQWYWQGRLCIQLEFTLPHQALTASNWDAVTALPHLMTIQYFLSLVDHLTCLKYLTWLNNKMILKHPWPLVFIFKHNAHKTR